MGQDNSKPAHANHSNYTRPLGRRDLNIIKQVREPECCHLKTEEQELSDDVGFSAVIGQKMPVWHCSNKENMVGTTAVSNYS